MWALWLQWSDGQTWATGHRQETQRHLLYYCCASATIVMALPARSLISLSTSVHSSMLACVKLSATTARLYTSFLPQRDDFTVARLAWTEETYADDENVTCGLDWVRKSFFHRSCFVAFGSRREQQIKIRYCVGSLDDNIDIKDSLMDCEDGKILHTCTGMIFFFCYISLISVDLEISWFVRHKFNLLWKYFSYS